MHAFTKFKFAKRVFLLLSGKIGISYKVKKPRAFAHGLIHYDDLQSNPYQLFAAILSQYRSMSVS